VVLRPRSVSEILDLALRFYTGPAAGLYAKLALLSALPAWALCLAAHWGLGLAWMWVWLLAIGLATPMQGLFTVAVGRLMFAERVEARVVIGQFMRRLPAYLGALLISRVQIAVLSLGVFVVLPVLWIVGRTAYVHEACLLEQAGPGESVKRAARMVEHNVIGAAWMLLALSVAALGFVCVAASLIDAGLLRFVLQVGQPFGSLLDEGGSAAALLGLFAAVPYWATARFLSYVDLRTRRDGWDVQLRFTAAAAAEHEQEAAA
jgi:hypothetical protein